MKIVEKREFINGWVAAVELYDGKLIETTATCLPFSTEMRGTGNTDNKAVDWNQDKDFWNEKFMIGVSTQSGCPVQCKFCAVNDLTERQGWRNLSAVEILEQVHLAIAETGRNPKDSKLFRVLFTRMGEPSLNHDNVLSAVVMLKSLYPNVRIQLSTVGLAANAIDFIKGIRAVEQIFNDEQFIELQLSIHSTDNNYRKWLQNEGVCNNKTLAQIAGCYFREIPDRKWKITLNFSLAEDTPFDIEDLKFQFDHRYFFIKVSNINDNCVSQKNSLVSLIQDRNVV